MRKILCVLMTVLMAALIPVEALAVSGDVILLHRESNQTITVSSAATVGDTAYMILRDQEGSAVWQFRPERQSMNGLRCRRTASRRYLILP